MKKLRTLVLADVQKIFRDPTLLFFLLIPFIITAALRFYILPLSEEYLIIKEYHQYIMMSAGIQTSIMFGFIIAFIVLEEKDEKVLEAIRVLPLSPSYFISYRLVFAAVVSFSGALFTISFSGLAYPGMLNSVFLAFLYSLAAPFISLFIATYAENKVEGMAYFKGIDLVLLIPIIGFVIGGFWSKVFVFVPTFWTFLLYQRSFLGEPILLTFIIGTVFYTVVIAFLVKSFSEKVFRR